MDGLYEPNNQTQFSVMKQNIITPGTLFSVGLLIMLTSRILISTISSFTTKRCAYGFGTGPVGFSFNVILWALGCFSSVFAILYSLGHMELLSMEQVVALATGVGIIHLYLETRTQENDPPDKTYSRDWEFSRKLTAVIVFSSVYFTTKSSEYFWIPLATIVLGVLNYFVFLKREIPRYKALGINIEVT